VTVDCRLLCERRANAGASRKALAVLRKFALELKFSGPRERAALARAAFFAEVFTGH